MTHRILSGVRPSGNLHLGNYLGAIKQWVNLQNEGTHELYFMLADLHSLDTIKDADSLRTHTLEVAALYIAAGIDPERSTIFAQSAVPAHTQLMWILSSKTQLGDLERMTQFKEKSAHTNQQRISAALLTYPILMAADILLYDAALVPVGDDQIQHLEFARDLAKRFNNTLGKDTFCIPERFAGEQGTRVMSLSDPTKKMAKSSDDPRGSLPLLADDDTLRKNVMRAITDSGDTIKRGSDKPALNNLIDLYAALTEKTPNQIESEFEGKGYGEFKSILADTVIDTIRPIREKAEELLQNPEELHTIIEKGAEQASKTAHTTLQRVQERIGLQTKL